MANIMFLWPLEWGTREDRVNPIGNKWNGTKRRDNEQKKTFFLNNMPLKTFLTLRLV